MSKWIENLQHYLSCQPVTIVHGNVRDAYVDGEGRVHQNLTALLKALAADGEITEFISYDIVAGERRADFSDGTASNSAVDPFAETAPDANSLGDLAPPARIIATWNELPSTGQGRFIVFQYLDKFISYKKSYTDEEQERLLWLEKTIENMSEYNRLVLVALQDSMVPIELYTHAPKTGLFTIPRPGVTERADYLRYRLPQGVADSETIEYVARLSDGLYLRQLHGLTRELENDSGPRSQRETRRLVNKYRVGEKEDYWGRLSIQSIRDAYDFFVEREGVKGQDETIGKVIDSLCLARAGLSGVSSGTASKPRGVLFFAGPTGVGKTLLAKKLAKFLFSTEDAFLRFDMSEFKEGHTVSKLIGSPPGYVGSEQGGALTNGIREKPFCVVLFDEIEKADPKILDIFLQILDDGRLTDSRGQTVYFTETMIIFTSNIGTRSVDSTGRPVEEGAALRKSMSQTDLSAADRQQQIRAHFFAAVERFFVEELSRPELLNRIGNRIVPFNPIDGHDVQRAIVGSHLTRIREEVADRYRKQRYTVDFDDTVVDWLVDAHGSRIAQFGGRGITNAVEDEILTPLARKLLHAEGAGNEDVELACSYCQDKQRVHVSAEVSR